LSLTQTNHVFASVHEHGINTFLKAFLTARPRYINYGTTMFVPVTSVAATNVSTISFPGIPGGIQYMVQFSIPVIDLFPPTGASPLPPGPGEMSLRVDVRATVACMKWSPSDQGREGKPRVSSSPLSTTLSVWAKGKPDVRFFGPGVGDIGFELEQVKIPALSCVGGKPDTLEVVVECVIRMLLQALLANLRIPFNALTIEFFKLVLKQGPEIADNQVKLWGDIV
jgi:hypothetical protein